MQIEIKELSHIYSNGTSNEYLALDNINIGIEKGEFIVIIGHTGSGKSTLIQHLNALLKPTKGQIKFEDKDIFSKDVKLSEIRKKVGLVFQYPEYQLFEETVEKDIAYGPLNLGYSDSEVEKLVKYSLDLVGMSYEEIKDKSPFDLSGGQKRRVAIAGVLAMRPDVLILDEPTAGLDPRGRKEILDNIKSINKKENTTIILVSHSMEDAFNYADKVVVLNKGKIEYFDKPRIVFNNYENLKKIGLDIPENLKLKNLLLKNGFKIQDDVLSYAELTDYLINYFREKNVI